MVNTDRVRAKGFHKGRIECALVAINERIIFGELVCHALDEELRSTAGEELGT